MDDSETLEKGKTDKIKITGIFFEDIGLRLRHHSVQIPFDCEYLRQLSKVTTV